MRNRLWLILSAGYFALLVLLLVAISTVSQPVKGQINQDGTPATDPSIFLLLFMWLSGIVVFLVLTPRWVRWQPREISVSSGISSLPAPPVGAPVVAPPPTMTASTHETEAAKPSRATPNDSVPLIFVSHASDDAELAGRLCSALESEGLRTWIASRDVSIGANYAAEIVRAVNSAQFLLVLLSPKGIESPHVRREVSIAIDRGVPVLPVSTDPTGEFMADLPVDWTYWLSLAQVFRMTDESTTAAEIARRIS